MDETNYTTEHRKGQHLTSEDRHIIEVRFNKDKRSIYSIAKELGRPYNTVKNEIMRGTVLLYNGKVRRYKADIGYSVYLEHRQECRRKIRYNIFRKIKKGAKRYRPAHKALVE